jgi:hypothetical protein
MYCYKKTPFPYENGVLKTGIMPIVIPLSFSYRNGSCTGY